MEKYSYLFIGVAMASFVFGFVYGDSIESNAISYGIAAMIVFAGGPWFLTTITIKIKRTIQKNINGNKDTDKTGKELLLNICKCTHASGTHNHSPPSDRKMDIDPKYFTSCSVPECGCKQFEDK